MDEQSNERNRPVNPRRKKRSKMQIFKEAYLPVVIAGAALLLIIIFIIGSVTRSSQRKKVEIEASIAASIALEEEEARMALLAEEMIAQADQLAADYEYQSAMDLLNTFPGNMNKYPALYDKLDEYEYALENMVAWEGPGKVVNLSFQLLIADPPRALNHSVYSSSFNKNFITTEEFSKILQQLYENNYVLVDMDDLITTETLEDGRVVYRNKTLYLPSGKKPLMLTQTNVNYNYYLIDSDGDKVADAGGGGFANKLLWDGTSFTNTLVDGSGNTVTGNFDLVPILEAFIAKNPTFSYRGARAILALTGYNGLFGYRTHKSAKTLFGQDAYDADVAEVKTLVDALRAAGYKLACYSYENISYLDSSVTEIQADLSGWTSEVVPIIGNPDIFTYAQLTDITDEPTYSGEKYQTLRNLGFRYFLGFCEDGNPWATVADDYVRQGRLLVTGANLAYHADWFTGMFDAAVVLDGARGQVPQ